MCSISDRAPSLMDSRSAAGNCFPTCCPATRHHHNLWYNSIAKLISTPIDIRKWQKCSTTGLGSTSKCGFDDFWCMHHISRSNQIPTIGISAPAPPVVFLGNILLEIATLLSNHQSSDMSTLPDRGYLGSDYLIAFVSQYYSQERCVAQTSHLMLGIALRSI